MTQNEKDLLIKDLCSRLPYGVKAYIKYWSKLDQKYYDGVFTVKYVYPSLNDICASTENYSVEVILRYADYFIKPYLFPLSSMTEEQKDEYHNTCNIGLNRWGEEVYYDSDESIDWLNAHHFDYRRLIEKSLALDATNLGIYE